MIAVLDFISSAFALVAILFLLFRRQSERFRSRRIVAVGLLSTLLIYVLFMALKWARITLELEYYENIAGAIVPAWILFLIYSEIQNLHMDDLEESKSNLLTTIHAIADAVITMDRNGRIVQMNPVAEAMTGWSNEQAFGLSIAEVYATRDPRAGREPGSQGIQGR